MLNEINNLSGIIWKKNVRLARGDEWFQDWRWDTFLVFYGYRYHQRWVFSTYYTSLYPCKLLVFSSMAFIFLHVFLWRCIFNWLLPLCNAVFSLITVCRTFHFRNNLDWLARATNWAKFSATASLGVIHRVSVLLLISETFKEWLCRSVVLLLSEERKVQ